MYEWDRMLHWLINEITVIQDDLATDAASDSSFEYLRRNLDQAHDKALKYFRLCDDAPIYFASVLLDPSVKQRFFQKLWPDWSRSDSIGQQYYRDVNRWSRELWEQEYKVDATQEIMSSVPAKRSYEDSISDRMFEFMNGNADMGLQVSQEAEDELQQYLGTDPVPFVAQCGYDNPKIKVFDSLQWWFERRQQYPALSRLAFECCAIPLMSDDCERAFSSARDLITYRRNSLKCDLIEVLELVRQWLGTPAPRRMKNKDDIDVDVSPFDAQEAIEADYYDAQA